MGEDPTWTATRRGDPGICATCGYLCKQSQRDDTLYYQASAHDRAFGSFSSLPATEESRPGARTHACCYVGAADLAAEMAQEGPPDPLAIINAPRDCPKWYRWQPGWNAKEHLEEQKMLELNQRRDEFEERVFKETQATQLEMLRMTQRQNRLTIVAIGVTFLATLLATLITIFATLRFSAAPPPDSMPAPRPSPASMMYPVQPRIPLIALAASHVSA